MFQKVYLEKRHILFGTNLDVSQCSFVQLAFRNIVGLESDKQNIIGEKKKTWVFVKLFFLFFHVDRILITFKSMDTFISSYLNQTFDDLIAIQHDNTDVDFHLTTLENLFRLRWLFFSAASQTTDGKNQRAF